MVVVEEVEAEQMTTSMKMDQAAGIRVGKALPEEGDGLGRRTRRNGMDPDRDSWPMVLGSSSRS